MKSDDQMDELLVHAARDYNAPGSVPRDEMWARIAAARHAARADQARLAPARSARWMWPSIAVAAALVLSVGIVIGRRLERSNPANEAHVPVVAVKPVVVEPHDSSAHSSAQTLAQRPDTSVDSTLGKLRDQTRMTDRRVRELAAADANAANVGKPAREGGDAARASTDTRVASGRRSGDNLAYQLVVLQHLAGSEALITAFRSSARRGEVDAQIASWSRELLGTTRMLEASSATQDPVMKRLLQDLDLVIAQIVQYTTRGTNDPEELDLIEQSIAKRGVITQLRSTLPRRTPSAGT